MSFFSCIDIGQVSRELLKNRGRLYLPGFEGAVICQISRELLKTEAEGNFSFLRICPPI